MILLCIFSLLKLLCTKTDVWDSSIYAIRSSNITPVVNQQYGNHNYLDRACSTCKDVYSAY
ncbi:hypothetical protein CCPUN_01530 [Cardinium endosymbiont of Culicoides punctatus]|nr:hypothetical protein CCPUN_01530 [Cardinium endosymbiont of Culicoides punctatus]